MRNYFFKDWDSLLTRDTVAQLTKIHEYKGEQTLFIEANPDILSELVEVAKIQSTEASNSIEGIRTSNERLKKLLQTKTNPKSRDEEEIAGYRDVLNTIHDSYEYIPIKSSMILQLHRDLYKFSGGYEGGSYKSSDNIIKETDEEGNEYVRFQPVSAWETNDAMNMLCEAYEKAINEKLADPLIIMAVFILDFLCIHPFDDGNGRMSRLLTLLILYRTGYIVGKYVSIEKIIDNTKETYYEVLQQSSLNWHEEKNDYMPFLQYMLGVILSAYKDFSERVEVISAKDLSKPDKIREIIKKNINPMTKAEIINLCPDISKTTIERTLSELQKSNEIIKIGGGRYTKYIWNREEE